MNKLEHIRQALENNSQIMVVSSKERFCTVGGSSWGHTVDIRVAPKKGIYTASALQDLMMTLVPSLEPSCLDEFDDSGEWLRFGKLYFDEVIGTITTHQLVTLTDETVLAVAEGFVDGKREIRYSREIGRRVWVRLYPSVQIAMDSYKENEYYITKRYLRWSFDRALAAILSK